MPNWAGGLVSVTGKCENVCSFVSRFIGYNEKMTGKKKYFARSFLSETKEDVLEGIRLQLEREPEKTGTATLFADFAWSAYSCIVSGYPEHEPEKLATLAEACVEDAVSVEIRTTECGMGFYEVIKCDASGSLKTECKDMDVGRCRNCGATQCLDPWEKPAEQECCECGHIGMIKLTKEELKKMEEEN